MTVFWTNEALDQLLAIHEYYAKNSKRYADRVIDRLTRRSEQIAAFPWSGRTVSEYADPEIREVVEAPFRIIYRIREEQLDVLAVFHGARRLPKAL